MGRMGRGVERFPAAGSKRKFRFSANTKKKNSARMARGDAASSLAAFPWPIRATQQISVRQGGVLLDRLAAHPHTRVQRHTENVRGGRTRTHLRTHTRYNTHDAAHFTPDTVYTQFRPESKKTHQGKKYKFITLRLNVKIKSWSKEWKLKERKIKRERGRRWWKRRRKKK